MNDEINPFASPAVSEPPGLSRIHRAVLEFYLRHRERPPTLLSLSMKFLLSWCGLAAMFVLSAAAMFLIGGWTIGAMFALWIGGFALGAFVRDVGLMRRTVQLWPLTQRILDWQKIEQLLEAGKNT